MLNIIVAPALQPNSAFLRRHRAAFRESHITSDGLNVTEHPNTNSVSFALNDSFITDPGFRGDLDNNKSVFANGSRMDDVSGEVPAAIEASSLAAVRWSEIDSSLAPLRGRKPQPKESNLVISLQKRQREMEIQLGKEMEEARWDRMLAAWAQVWMDVGLTLLLYMMNLFFSRTGLARSRQECRRSCSSRVQGIKQVRNETVVMPICTDNPIIQD